MSTGPAPKVLMGAGLGLALVMTILLRVGTTSEGLFAFWIVLLLAGVGMVALGRKLDADARDARYNAEREQRIHARRAQPEESTNRSLPGTPD